MNYVIANWKQHKTAVEAAEWCQDFARLVGTVKLHGVVPVICPPMPLLEQVRSTLAAQGVSVALGVQDISPFTDGAHTGQVGVNQVRELCTYAIVGHSEQQALPSTVVAKASQCLSAGIVPIVCFKAREDYQSINGAMYALEDPQNISVAGVYRPKAIQDVAKLVGYARQFFEQGASIMYGGSVTEDTAQALAQIDGLNGVLVGNASLNPAEFVAIIRRFSL
jgi:triosephosphate isomerase